MARVTVTIGGDAVEVYAGSLTVSRELRGKSTCDFTVRFTDFGTVRQSMDWPDDRRFAALLALLPDPSDLLQRKLLWEEVDRLGLIRRPEARPKQDQWELFG